MIELTDQERSVGQLHESSGDPVDRVGRADHGQPDRPGASAATRWHTRAPMRSRWLAGPAG